ncbi:hypothetical protein [Roseixanthobacter pseudopolyaromaticivorans]|uniref:hypothetical protein n=1 Tax=Xanthobacteraceae TaxID=335928 RepID=UPI00372B9899
MVSFVFFLAIGVISIIYGSTFLSKDACRYALPDRDPVALNIEELNAALAGTKNAIICWSSVSALFAFGLAVLTVTIFCYFQYLALKARL